MSWMNRFRQLFGRTQASDLVTPSWINEGYQAAQKTNQRKNPQPLEQIFEERYRQHVRACKEKRLQPSIPNKALEHFTEGWNKALEEH